MVFRILLFMWSFGPLISTEQQFSDNWGHLQDARSILKDLGLPVLAIEL